MRGSVPLLDAFHRKHPSDPRVQALAFHDPAAFSLESLDATLEPIAARLWGGKVLAVPVLIDPTGETVHDFGIDEYPTVILIDPVGNVAAAGNEALLPELLERLETELARGKAP